jgi:hypothetical protein
VFALYCFVIIVSCLDFSTRHIYTHIQTRTLDIMKSQSRGRGGHRMGLTFNSSQQVRYTVFSIINIMYITDTNIVDISVLLYSTVQ